MKFCWNCSYFMPNDLNSRLMACGHFFCSICFDRLDEEKCAVCKRFTDDQSTALDQNYTATVPSNTVKELTLDRQKVSSLVTNLMMDRIMGEIVQCDFDLSKFGWFVEDQKLMSETESMITTARDDILSNIKICDQLRQLYRDQLNHLPIDEINHCKLQLSRLRQQLGLGDSSAMDQYKEDVSVLRQEMGLLHDAFSKRLTDVKGANNYKVCVGIFNRLTQDDCRLEFDPSDRDLSIPLKMVWMLLRELITDWIKKDDKHPESPLLHPSTPHSSENVFVSYQPEQVDNDISLATLTTSLSSIGNVATTPVMKWSDLAKQNCPVRLPKIEKTVAETNSPHCFLDIQIRNLQTKRVVIRLRPDKAPFMVDNFIQLCLGTKGYGYKGSKVFRAMPNNHVLAGDFENNNGSGGHSIHEGSKLFLAEQCPLKDCKGAVRMRGMQRTPDGRCKVGSQFMFWVGDIAYKEYRFTLVFGHVTEGMSHLRDISKIGTFLAEKDNWLLKESVTIVNCGVL